jgi:hypothetical protein
MSNRTLRNRRRRQRQRISNQIVAHTNPQPVSNYRAATNSLYQLNPPKQQRVATAKRPRRRPGKIAKVVRAQNAPVPMECSLAYASALADPEYSPAGACIPYGFPVPSQRCKVFLRTQFTIGTGGSGYALFNPVISNDDRCLFVTTPFSTGTISTALINFVSLGVVTMSRLPYSAAQMNNAAAPIEGRMVSAVLKARYLGTEANRNGAVLALEDANHVDLTLSSYTAFSSALNGLNERPQPNGSWHEVKYSGPVAQNEVTFLNQSNFSRPPFMVIYARGNPGDVFDCEVYMHVEYSGTNVTETLSTQIDTEGYSTVTSTFKNLSAAAPIASNAVTAFAEYLTASGTSLPRLIAHYTLPTLMKYISPPLLRLTASSNAAMEML